MDMCKSSSTLMTLALIINVILDVMLQGHRVINDPYWIINDPYVQQQPRGRPPPPASTGERFALNHVVKITSRVWLGLVRHATGLAELGRVFFSSV